MDWQYCIVAGLAARYLYYLQSVTRQQNTQKSILINGDTRANTQEGCGKDHAEYLIHLLQLHL